MSKSLQNKFNIIRNSDDVFVGKIYNLPAEEVDAQNTISCFLWSCDE